MNKDKFWQIIDEAREKNGAWQDMYGPLHGALSMLDESDIVHWQQIFYEYQALSCKQKLWAAAAVMMGGCSDDSFDYFRGWLTAQGKEVFLNALADPESLAGVSSVQALAREASASIYTPLKGYIHDARFESMLYVARRAYEIKTGRSLYNVVDDHPLSEQEKSDIASEIVYAEDIDTEWGGLATSWLETDAELEEILPMLHGVFNNEDGINVDAENYTIVERVCANTPDGSHMLIIQALCEDSGKTVWAIGDDKVCAITQSDCVRNDIPYNSVVICEFPYDEHTPQTILKWLPLVKEMVELTIIKYLEHDGSIHIDPAWLPENFYAHLGKEKFKRMCESCDHIILRDNNTMDFVPQNAKSVKRQKRPEFESVVDKIRQSKQTTQPQKPKQKNHKKDGPEH